MVNSGNANAFTGKTGAEAVKALGEDRRQATGAPRGQIFLASTGVIGEPLDATKFTACWKSCAEARPDGLARRRARHHDHRHLPEARDREGDDRRRRGDASAASPRARA